MGGAVWEARWVGLCGRLGGWGDRGGSGWGCLKSRSPFPPHCAALTLKNGGNVLIPCYPTVSE